METNKDFLVFLENEFKNKFSSFERSAQLKAVHPPPSAYDCEAESLLQLKYISAPLISPRSPKGNNLFSTFSVTISVHFFDFGFHSILYVLTYTDETKMEKFFSFPSMRLLFDHVTTNLRITNKKA